ncbi:MAG: LLM class flavin-dependent oxidoreductase [Solirubrobacterales bacterium]
MRYGIAIFLTDDAPDPAIVARLVEERGFESLFLPEHTHIPASRRTAYPAGGELPGEYSRTHDPFIALTAAAAATETLLVATGICLVIERDPIIKCDRAPARRARVEAWAVAPRRTLAAELCSGCVWCWRPTIRSSG